MDDNYKLIIQAGSAPEREVELTKVETIIGRDPTVDLTIDAPVVSRRHARIVRQDGDYFIEDLGSSNGTFLNGERLERYHLLNPGDQIRLGSNVELKFVQPISDGAGWEAPAGSLIEGTLIGEEMDQTVGAEEEAPPEAPPEEPPTLVVEFAEATSAHPLTEEMITLGRAPDNVISVPSRIVSRYHARLEKVGERYRIVVLPEASNPILFQGEPVPGNRLLQHGDTLHIGRPDSQWRVTLSFLAPQQAAAQQVAEAENRTFVAEPEADDETVLAGDGGGERPRIRQAPGDADSTMMVDSFEPSDLDVGPPRLKVQIAGNAPGFVDLERPRITIGRAEDNDIILPSKIVSRHHAYLERENGGYRVVPLEATNPLLLEGRPLPGPRTLHHENKLRIGGRDPGSMVTMTYLSPAEAIARAEAQTVRFDEKTVLTIGRDATNDIVLDNPAISRYHAQVERVGSRYRVIDLRSSNGTFVNDERIDGETWLSQDDAIRIGPYRFVMGQDALDQYDETGGMEVEAAGLNKWVRKDLNILQDISVVFKPREFIVIVGQSGGGKTTLLDAIAGYRPATHGTVQVNEINVYKNFDVIRNDIGYVPQRDIIHMELTVYQALDYAAQLRMPPDTTKEERHQRILEVLEDLDLTHRRDTQISELSGGQIKRVSIGVELLTKPGLFFLDEPTSGLDPGTETAFMHLMRRLADQGRTIALVTHATKNVMLADKVVFLARGGYLAWFGPPEEALEYFDQFRDERARRAHDIEFDEIYAILDDRSKGSPEDWAERYRNHPAYRDYIAEPLRDADVTPEAAPGAVERQAPAPPRQVSSLRQFLILSARNVKILTRDRFGLALMLAAAPLVSLLDVILALVLGRDPFDFTDGSMPNVLITLFLPTVYGVMVGGLAQMREIVKEQEIYKRERLVNLRLFPYILSKIWVAAVLALYQSLVYSGVHYLAFEMPGGITEFLLIYVSLALATMAGMMLGLFASALAPNPNTAPLIIILLMLPQIVLGGALVPIPEVVSAPISTRWAFEAFMGITGPGSDVAADACWSLPPEQRTAIADDLDYKNANCNCMGVNALDQDSCDFPGVGQFASEALNAPPPDEPGDPPAKPEGLPPELSEPPEPPGERPEEPELPPQPVRPEDESDNVAMANYFEDLEEWQDEVEEIQDGYRVEIAAYEAEVDAYQAALEAYQEDVASFQTEESEAYQEELQAYQDSVLQYQTAVATWEGERLAAVVPAEAMIRQFERDFGWTFVNKENESVYWSTILGTWIAQFIIIGVLFVAILVVQKRKDVL